MRQYLIDSWKDQEQKPEEYPIESEQEVKKQMKTVTKYPTSWYLQVGSLLSETKLAALNKLVNGRSN